MNNRQLDELLRKAKAPNTPQTYWEEFPGDVTRAIGSSLGRAKVEPRAATPGLRWVLSLGLAAACVVAAFLIGYGAGTKSSHTSMSVASVEKCLKEVETMFPNQVRAIVFTKDGPQLLLSENADVPMSSPVWVKVCDSKGCESIVTFSGQRVPIKGELCDVLVDSKQNVLVVGQQEFWPGGMPAKTKVEARTL
jgi:hypothetical protein